MKHKYQLSLVLMILIAVVCPISSTHLLTNQVPNNRISTNAGSSTQSQLPSNKLLIESKNVYKYPPHVSEMLLGGFPPVDADAHLWKNFNNAKYQSPVMNGVHGGNWSPPLADPGNGGFKISSPVPKAKVNKIIAGDLPSATVSGTSFDLPKRKDVVQIDLPVSRQKTIQYEVDPTKKNNTFGRKSYFGSQRMIKPKPIGLKRFLQIDLSPSQISTARNDALNAAQTAEKKAAELFGKISANPLATQMIIPIVTTNKQEQPSLRIKHKK